MLPGHLLQFHLFAPSVVVTVTTPIFLFLDQNLPYAAFFFESIYIPEYHKPEAETGCRHFIDY